MNKVALRDSIYIILATLAKLSGNQQVNMDILARIWKELKCNIVDIVDYIQERWRIKND